MSSKPPVFSTIEAYRKKRQKANPLILYAFAAALVVIGVIIIILSFSGGGFTLFATKVPSPTESPFPSNTLFPSDTPTITSTPTQTGTGTPGAPFIYIIQEGDSLIGICEEMALGENCLLLIYLLNPTLDPLLIFAGSEIVLPNPGMVLPTPTPIPDDAIQILYFVLPGDYLGLIAQRYNTTIDAIVRANPDILEDENSPIYPGQYLEVPINRVTPIPTSTATITPTQ